MSRLALAPLLFILPGLLLQVSLALFELVIWFGQFMNPLLPVANLNLQTPVSLLRLYRLLCSGSGVLFLRVGVGIGLFLRGLLVRRFW